MLVTGIYNRIINISSSKRILLPEIGLRKLTDQPTLIPITKFGANN